MAGATREFTKKGLEGRGARKGVQRGGLAKLQGGDGSEIGSP